MESVPTAEQRIATEIYYQQRVEDLLNYGRALPQAQPRSESRSVVPQQLELLSCYPNPFNPSTRINYSLGQATNVEIKVYNLQGQLVTTLLDERLDAGRHQTVFRPEDLATGLYFISIATPDMRQVEKVMFIK